MWCKVCSCIEKKDKLFTPKLDTLWKHVGRQKVKVVIFGVVVGMYFYN